MVKSWIDFFKDLPDDIRKKIDILAKYDIKEKERLTKELKYVYETDTRIPSDFKEIEKKMRAFGLFLNSKIPGKKHTHGEPEIEEQNVAEVQELLKDSDLISKVVSAIQLKSSVVGEGKTIQTILIVVFSTKCVNVNPTSKNLHPTDETGVGKDFAVKAVRGVFPNINWIHIKNPSPKALTYLANPESKGDAIEITSDAVVHIEDAEENFINGSDFKTYCSDSLDTLRVSKDLKGKRFQLPKPVFFVTSCDTTIGTQLLRRLPSLGLDSSCGQTKKIIGMQKRDGGRLPQEITGGKHKKSIQLVIDALQMLEKVYVMIPEEIGDKIEKLFGEKPEIIARTLHKTFQDYIKMSATLHQFQRKTSNEDAIVDGESFKTIIASEKDFQIGKDVFETLYKGFGEELLPLNKRQRKLLDQLKKNPGMKYTIQDVAGWKCHTSKYGTIRADLKTIANNTMLNQESGYPITYVYPGRMKVKPVKNG